MHPLMWPLSPVIWCALPELLAGASANGLVPTDTACEAEGREVRAH